MSILSDRQIKNLCATPTHFRLRTGQELEWIAPPYSDEEIALVKRASDIQWQHDQVREFDPMVREHLSMIDPFVPHQVREEDNKKIVSYGLSSYGYDIRIAPEFKIFTNINSTVIDPLDFDENSFVDFEGDVCIIPPNSFVLARSIEYFRMPKNVTGIVLAKSTYARTGMSCLATPLEAGWEGHVTLEYANSTPLPMKLYANQGAAQVLFFEGEPCMTTYADRGGKYQGQTGITLPRG